MVRFKLKKLADKEAKLIMLYLLIDSISEFFGSHFRCGNHPILYFFIRSIILGIFIFLLALFMLI